MSRIKTGLLSQGTTNFCTSYQTSTSNVVAAVGKISPNKKHRFLHVGCTGKSVPLSCSPQLADNIEESNTSKVLRINDRNKETIQFEADRSPTIFYVMSTLAFLEGCCVDGYTLNELYNCLKCIKTGLDEPTGCPRGYDLETVIDCDTYGGTFEIFGCACYS